MKTTTQWLKEYGKLVPFSELSIMICPSNNYGRTRRGQNEIENQNKTQIK